MKPEERTWNGGTTQVPFSELPDCCQRHAKAYDEYVFFECPSCGAVWDEAPRPDDQRESR